MNAIELSTRKKVRKFLKQMYGEAYQLVVAEIDGAFVLRRGSADVRVSVRPLTDDDCIIEASSAVVQGARVTGQLMNFLLRQNSVNPFGAFALLFDDTVLYKHSIMGAHVDFNEFRTTVRTVAFVADEMDDVISTLAGGRRAADLLPPPARLASVKAAPKKATPKKVAPKKAAPKKAAPKKAAPKKAAPKKAAPKKAAPKKATPKKATPKKATPKNATPKKVAHGKPRKG